MFVEPASVTRQKREIGIEREGAEWSERGK